MAKFWIIYLIVVNVNSFVQMGSDKRAAIKGERRIPEKSLILGAVGGGSIGAIAGMYCFHHKTLHAKFRYGLPAILIGQIALLTWVNSL